MANTIIFKEDWKQTLQDTLAEPTFWKETARVDYADRKVIHNPYRNRTAAASITKGSAYSVTDVTVTDDTADITNNYVAAEFIDRADMGMAGYDFQMEMAKHQGLEIDETVETAFLGAHSQAGQTVDDSDLTTATSGGTGPINFQSASLDLGEVLRKTRQKLVEGRGLNMFQRNGASIIWRPVDFEKVVAYAQSQGFTVADDALTGGRVLNLGGFKHYESNLVDVAASTAHALAFVNGSIHVGVYNGTYGDVTVVEEPNRTSGYDVVSRVDYVVKVWNNMAPLVCDINIDE